MQGRESVEHRDQDFRDRDVVLSGKFSGCTFSNCRVVFRGDAFDLVACNFDDDTEWVFEEGATRTFNLLSMLYQLGGPSGQARVEEIFESVRRGVLPPGLAP